MLSCEANAVRKRGNGVSNGNGMCYNEGKPYERGEMRNEDFKGGRADVV